MFERIQRHRIPVRGRSLEQLLQGAMQSRNYRISFELPVSHSTTFPQAVMDRSSVASVSARIVDPRLILYR